MLGIPVLGAEQKPHRKLQDLTLTVRHGITVPLPYALEAKLFMLVAKRIHQFDKLVAFYCLQAANQRRSATMPSCKGTRVSELDWPASCYKTLLQYPSTSAG